MIESVLAALKTGRNIYCDEKNINPLKIHYGDIVILLATRELFRKQKKIDLSFTEFEILHLLMRNPGRVFSKEQIYDIIWNEPYSGDYNVVMRHICNIREKIEDDPGHVVLLSYFMDMSDAHIAREMNLVRSTINEHRRRSLELMRKNMEESANEKK